MSGNLTRAQRVLLQIASDLGGTISVFPDQRANVNAMIVRGFMIGC
jgi:hypothetical protein